MERTYRDAVHNIIKIDIDSPSGELIGALVDSAEFQRLRRIRQLGLAYFAYQSAEHSRFTHSLGAFHLATRCLDRLRLNHTISEEDYLAVQTAALLHDLGHGPFSHVIEGILGFHHEDFSVQAIESAETQVGQILSGFSKDLQSDIASIIRGDFRKRSLAQLVSSQLDVDRMDYLLRDSMMTGAKYGIYDLEWIVKAIQIDEENDRLYISAPAIYAVEDYLQARYYMFRQVYYHRTLRAAEAVLKKLLERAMKVFAEGGDVWFVPGSSFEKILSASNLSLSQHLALDDSDVFFHIKQWRKCADLILADLSARFLDRRLFRAIDLDMAEDERATFLDGARRIVADAGYDPDYYLVEDSMSEASNYFYTSNAAKPKDLIYVEHGFSRPEIREISEVSAAVRGLQEGYSIHRVAFPIETLPRIFGLYPR